MADRPIIFSAPMVRALLEGRKTQTRRIIKPVPEYGGGGRARDSQNWSDPDGWGWENHDKGCWDLLSEGYTGRPYYAPGDRLWVKEAHSLDGEGIEYRVDYEALQKEFGWGVPPRWRPSIHMPRRASRLTLTVTDVRVQRLQEISAEDCAREGVVIPDHVLVRDGFMLTARKHFRDLWNSIHGPDAWAADPWVVALTFTVARGNIDAVDSYRRAGE